MDPRWLLIAIPVAMVAFLVGYFTGKRNGYWDGFGAATDKAVDIVKSQCSKTGKTLNVASLLCELNEEEE